MARVNSKGGMFGAQQFSQVFQGVAKDTQLTVLRAGLAAAAKPVVAMAKRLAPKETGALRASIVSDVRKSRKGGWYAIVGPDRQYYRNGKRVKVRGGFVQGGAGADRPANYAHLVEHGHIKASGGSLSDKHNTAMGLVTDKYGRQVRRRVKTTVREKAKGRAVGFVAPRPFLRPAFAASGAESGAAFIAAAEKEIVKSVERHRARSAGKR